MRRLTTLRTQLELFVTALDHYGSYSVVSVVLRRGMHFVVLVSSLVLIRLKIFSQAVFFNDPNRHEAKNPKRSGTEKQLH